MCGLKAIYSTIDEFNPYTMEIFESASELPKFKDPIELSNWMRKNISYEHDDATWKLRSAQQVYHDKKGDCHDQSLFEQYVFDKQFKKYKHGRLFMTEYFHEDLRDGDWGATHTLLWYIKDKKYYWFENAWGNMAGINGPYDNIKGIEDAVKRHFDFEGKDKRFHIAPLKRVKPGMTLNEYCMKQM